MKGILGVLLVLGAAAGASADAGSNAGEFLRFGMGARAPALGDAGVAAAEGAAALHYNPAWLAFGRRAEVDLMYQDHVLSIGQGTIGYASPWGARSGWGASVTYVDYGTAARTTVSTATGTVTAVGAGTFGGRDAAWGVSYGRRLGEAWAVGATLKGISSSIDDASASAFAADVGLAWRSPRIPLRFGVAVRNVGTGLRYDRVKEDLPLLVRAGAAYSLWDERLTVRLDLEAARRESAEILVGAEYRVVDALSLRFGYDGRFEGVDDGLTAGAGFRYRDLTLDYAFVPFGAAGETHRIGLRYEFGP